MPVRGAILKQQKLTIQVLNPVRSPSGSVDPQWQDALRTTGKVNPLTAAAVMQFQQQGVVVSHKVRLEGWPTWPPLNSKDRGYLYPGVCRFLYEDADGRQRVLLYKGDYSPGEAGRWRTVTALEETWQQQFPR